MTKVEEIKFDPTHKVNFSTRVMRVLNSDGSSSKFKYGMWPKNKPVDLDPSKSIMFECTEDLSIR